MRQGKSLQSSNGKYKLILQRYGNLELICESLGLLWSTNTINANADFLYFVKNELVLRGKDNTSLWKVTYRGKSPEMLIVQDDGNLVLYDTLKRSLWSTNTQDKCRRKYKPHLNNILSTNLPYKFKITWLKLS